MRPVDGPDQDAEAPERAGAGPAGLAGNRLRAVPHSITDLVDGLERHGLAERRPDPTDRRAKLVAITEAGEVSLEVANAIRERALTQIFGALSEEDRATLLRLLDSLDEAAGKLTPAPCSSAVPA